MNLNKKTLLYILIALALADFLGAIDSTGVNIALPKMTSDLGIPIVISQWIPNAYTVVLVSMLIFMGRLGEIVGPKKLYLLGLAIFGITSLALGFVNATIPLIVIRGLQGLGTAILYTMPMAIIAHLWTEREKAFAVTASFFAAGMLVGPLIGGLLTGINLPHFFGWHFIFLLNIPFIIFAIYVSGKFIPELPARAGKIEFGSVLFLLATLTIIVLSLSNVISRPWILLGLVLLVMLYYYETRKENPLVDFSLFLNRTFTAANLVSFLAMVTIIGMSFVLTFYLQSILGWSSTKAGLAFIPVPIATGLVATLGGRIRNWRLGAFLASSLILLGILVLTFANPNISYFAIVLPGIILISAGSGFLMSVIFAAIIGSAPTEKSGSASGLLNTLQQLGALIGIALVASTVLQYRTSFWILAGAAFLGFIAAFFVKNQKIEVKAGAL